MKWSGSGFGNGDKLVSCFEGEGCLFKLKTLMKNHKSIGFPVGARCFDNGIAVFIGIAIRYYHVIIGEETLSLGYTGVSIVINANGYLSFRASENAGGGILLDIDDAEANILTFGFPTAVFFVDFVGILESHLIQKFS